MKKIIIMIMLILIILTTMSHAITFRDVSTEQWYSTYVYDLAEKGVINGYLENGESIYKPDQKVTTAEFIKLIIVASAPNIKYNLIETDMNHWSAKYLKVAENYGIVVEGEISLEELDEEVDRITVVRMLSRSDTIIRKNKLQSLNKFYKDVGDLTDSERIYLSHATAIGVINGDPEGTFRPHDGLKRSECAKILHTYMNVVAE